MSQYLTVNYRDINTLIPESDEDNQVNSSPQPTTSPSPPSSEEFTSDPTRIEQVTITPSTALPKSEQTLPSTALEFNFSRTQTEPTVVTDTTHNPINAPLRTTHTHTRAMSHTPIQIGVNALPIQGKRDAPRTFKGHYDKVEEFLKTMDKLFARYQVTLDEEKVEAILPYCTTKVQDFIHSSPSFNTPDWESLKEHMMEYYDAERANRKYTPNDIWSFNKLWNHKSITNLTQWKKYYREFFSKAGGMLTRKEISDKDFRTLFWLGLPENIRQILEPKIQAKLEDYDASVPYEIADISSVANNYFKRNKFTEMVFNPLKYQPDDDSDSETDESSSDSDSDSDYDSKRRRKYKKKKRTKHAKKLVEIEKPTQRYQGSEQEIEGMIQQLNTMSLQDPKYGHLYYKVMKLDTTGLAQKCVYREPPHFAQTRISTRNNPPMTATSSKPMIPRQNPPSTFPRQNSPATFPNNFPIRNRGMPTPIAPGKCYGCAGDNHMLGECPRMKELVNDGLAIYDVETRKYRMPDGRNIMRRPEETISEAVLRMRSMSFRPIGVASSNLITLDNEVQNYYHQVQYDSDDEYESEEEEGPYWKIALQTTQDYGSYEEEEYENEGEYGYYVDPTYQAYPAERSSTRIAEAREKASRMPIKASPKVKFEGVFPPSRKIQNKPGQNLPPKQAVPLPAPPAPKPQPTVVHPPAQPIPKPTPLAPRIQQPIDA